MKKRISMVLLGSVVALLLTSCQRLEVTPEESKLTSQATYGSRTVEFERWKYGSTYNSGRFVTDFGNTVTYQGEAKVLGEASDQNLKIKLKAGQTDSGGFLSTAALSDKSAYTLEYRVKFVGRYEWTKGGKLPGLCGGSCNRGGTSAGDGKGWSVRLMWEGPGEGPGIRPYVYHQDQPGTYGDDFDAAGQGVFRQIKADTWYKIKIYVKLNTGSSDNGTLKIWVDNQLEFSKTNIRYRTDGRPINRFLFRVFHGGKSDVYKPKKDQYVRIDSIKWY